MNQQTQTPVPTETEDESGADISSESEVLPDATTTSVQQESPTRIAPGAEQKSEKGGVVSLLIPVLVIGIAAAGYLIYRRRK